MRVCVYCIRPGSTARIEGQGVDRANTGNPKHCAFAVGKYALYPGNYFRTCIMRLYLYHSTVWLSGVQIRVLTFHGENRNLSLIFEILPELQ